jgi:hypothetical protein
MNDESAEAGAEAKTRGEPGVFPAPEPEGSPVAEFLAAMRRRPALTIFLFGLVLFAGGLVSVIGSQIRGAGAELPADESKPGPQSSAGGRVGPALGEPVGPYIEKKKSTLSERARSDPRGPTLGMVVFKEYRTAGQVDAFLKARNMEALTAQVRVPVRGFRPSEVPLESKSLADAASGMRKTLNRELESLEEIAGQTEDPAFRSVYTNDVKLYEEALGKLTTDPATIFAVVVRSTHANLSTAARAAEVRFVDLPDDPTATLEDTTFAAVIPEDAETATFAVS